MTNGPGNSSQQPTGESAPQQPQQWPPAPPGAQPQQAYAQPTWQPPQPPNAAPYDPVQHGGAQPFAPSSHAAPSYPQYQPFAQQQRLPQQAPYAYGAPPLPPQSGWGQGQQHTNYGAQQRQQSFAQGARVQAAPAQVSALPVPTRLARRAALTWILVALGLAAFAVAIIISVQLGPGARFLAFLMSLIPLGIVVTAVLLIDRWEPEPWPLRIFALAWGGTIAVLLTLGISEFLIYPFLPKDEYGYFASMAIVAPIVEESTKGLGLVLLLFIARRAINGPIDGLVYGMLVGAGFAFTENILYFGDAFGRGQANGNVAESLVSIFFLRGILSPFAHAMFTGATGLAIGLAMRKNNRAAAIGFGGVGAFVGMLLHGYWNGSSYLANFFVVYIFTLVPLFALFIVGIVLLRRAEQRLTRTRLGDYQQAGWFSPQEVRMLATLSGRRGALQWAASLPGNQRPLMKQFIKDATQLAATRQRALSGRDPLAAQDERALLLQTNAVRENLLASASR